MKGTIAFDMDGVLVEVSESYRESIVQTVKRFSGQTVSRDTIQDYKNQGGWNNDWALAQRILADLGMSIEYADVVAEFNRIFFGENGEEGLIMREVWFDTTGVLQRLQRRFHLAIFTGRARYELDPTIQRFAKELKFYPVICADDVQQPKPHPEGLIKIRSVNGQAPIWYIGDTVDDARSAHAADVPFIGVVSPQHSRRDEVLELFRQEKAIAVVDDINQLESVLP